MCRAFARQQNLKTTRRKYEQQRSNENGNRILRRFVPKGTDIGKLTVAELQQIEDWVNNYPRKILGYKSANQMTA